MQLFPAEFSKRASKDIKQLDSSIKSRIKEKIDTLEQNPFPQEVVRVEGYDDQKIFRVRVGSYRILYKVTYSPRKLVIMKVDKRERVYD